LEFLFYIVTRGTFSDRLRTDTHREPTPLA